MSTSMGSIPILTHELQPGEAFPCEEGRDVFSGEGRHLIVTLNGRRAVLPQYGGSKELGKGLWLTILKQLDIKE
jgi:hypothetical protein